ncbi:hypothetical protein BDV29DRAFT_158045 [Aspergillus leporis]|uniref:LysM domain-containing protein n=1 Tax=Aspergillus leporis TaxID=41062 RepID=A0A5N5WWU0_9EURO|nr:hypothetical protein BDV29DRAFT_158045 [Aspergillus leporis]
MSQPPILRAPGQIEGCISWFSVSGAIDCDIMLANIQLSMDVFYQMNPSVKQDCSGISLGTYYCDSTLHIGLINPGDDDGVLTTTSSIPTSTAGPGEIVTPTPTQARMVSNCNKFYLAQPDDGCWAIANDHGIIEADLHACNPAIGTNCAKLWPTYYVCVGVIVTTISPTVTVSLTTSPKPSTPRPNTRWHRTEL